MTNNNNKPLLDSLKERKADAEKNIGNVEGRTYTLDYTWGFHEGRKDALEQVITQVEGIVKALQEKKDDSDGYEAYAYGYALDLLGSIKDQQP